MRKTLYLECNAGISGDMMVASLLDLGADREVLLEVLDSIPADGFSIEIGRVKKAGIDCCDFRVLLDHAHENHDHDMEYLHGHAGHCGETHVHGHYRETAHAHGHDQKEFHIHGHDQEACHVHGHMQEEQHMHNHDQEAFHIHSHDQEEFHVHGHIQEARHVHDHIYETPHVHGHHHGEPHVHSSHGHAHHVHRGMKEIREILQACRMTEHAREIAGRIFEILAQSEAKAHNVSVDEVHFHEVGAVDSIVDIVSVAVCLDNLGVTDVIVPKLCEGTGTVRCRHGILPVPVPAVANILSAYGIRVELTGMSGEFVTPTGAAIVAAIRTSDRLPGSFVIDQIGLGAGKRQYERPSILRAMLIDRSQGGDVVYKLETNMDDCTGEALGYVMERLLEAGARDVHYIPVYMKKNRPAWQLNVICDQGDIPEMERIIFSETTTIGIRRVEMERSILSRRQMQVNTDYGEAVVKVCDGPGGKRYYPEYESVARICREYGLPYRTVFEKLTGLAVKADRIGT